MGGHSFLGDCFLDSESDSFLSLFEGESLLSDPFNTFGVLLFESLVFGDDLSDWGLFLLSFNSLGGLSDVSVEFLVELFNCFNLGGSDGGVPFVELFFVFVLVLFLEVINVPLDVETEDVISVFLGVVGTSSFTFGFNFTSLVGGSSSLLNVISRESLGVVGDEKSSIDSSFHGSENSVSSGGSDETNI